jgi:hypothetical protein
VERWDNNQIHYTIGFKGYTRPVVERWDNNQTAGRVYPLKPMV